MIWEGLLDTRIRMQKVVELANRLPAPESRDSFVAEAKEKDLDLESELQNASQQVYRFLNEILSLREVCSFMLVRNEPVILNLVEDPLAIQPNH